MNDSATETNFDGRLALVDFLLPFYRRRIYELLAPRITGGFGVFTGNSGTVERDRVEDELKVDAFQLVQNRHFLRGPAEVIWQPGAVEWLASFEPDVVFACANPRILSMGGARRWAQRRGVPVLAWGLGTLMLAQGFERLRRAGRRRFIRGFDGVIAYSSRARDEYIAEGVPVERVFVVHNAATARPTHPLPERTEQFADPPRVLFVGRVYEGKRLGLLFDALARIQASSRPFLEVVGDGPDLEALRIEGKQKLGNGVSFTGALRGEPLAAAFKRGDLFVLPGLGGLAIQEAMSWGLPVVVAEGDGTQIDLVRKDNGWLMPPGDVEALELILRDAFSDCQRLRAMGKESYRIVDEELNLERMIDELVVAATRIRAMT
jgi:glycosyltransferase involved in cell wall biosynthesis